MRKHQKSLTGSARVSALIIAATLFINAGTGNTQTPAKNKIPPPPPKQSAPKPPPPRTIPAPPPQQVPPKSAPTQPIPPRPQAVPQRPIPNQPVPPRPQVTPPTQPVHPVQPVRPAPVVPMDTKGHFNPPPNSTTKPLAGGRKETTMPDGTKVQTNAAGQATLMSKPSGTQARLNPNTGRPTMVRKVAPDGTGVMVHNAPNGVRSSEYVKKDASGHPVRVVTRGNVQYREREFRTGYRVRTYSVDRRTYTRVYHTTSYRRYGAYPVYVPAYYYGPGFYTYFGSPWALSINFGWGSYPGYGSYGYYFAPAGVYASPSAWMADYVIADNLKGNYAAQQTADPGSPEPQDGSTTPIPADVRSAYVQEVQTQIQDDQAQASGRPVVESVPGALNPKFRIFQSYSDVEADNNGEQCAITGGDFVRREEDTPDANGSVTVTVVSIAKPTVSHCQANTRVRVTVDSLQEWYNGFIESQQQGFEAMVAMQGHNGVPPAPDTLKVANPDGQAPPDDPTVLAGAVQEAQTNASSAQTEIQTGGGQ